MGNFSLLLSLPGFRNMVISLLATYVNILNVYAFCNIHNFSWGTKGDNTTPMDLGVAGKAMITEKEVEAVEMELEDGIDAADRNYDEALET